jgi:hypothetical protein
MSEAAQFTIGSDVACSDGVGGELTRVVVDPVARALTYLVVEPHHRREAGRLVPIELVESTDGGIRLRCTMNEFGALADAEITEFVPEPSGDWGYGQGQVLSLPYFILGMGIDGSVAGPRNMEAGPHVVMHDRVPVGDVEVRRGEQVHATDGDIGRVRGLVIDPSDNHVTHFLLDAGHLWGHKTVAIPIGAVTDVAVGVRLSLTKDEVRDLPPVDLLHPE